MSSKALFVKDADTQTPSVWVTDGAPSGTFELPLTVDAGFQNLSLLESFDVFDDKLIYFATESSINSSQEKLKMYVTDGSIAGTSVSAIDTDINLAGAIGGGQVAQLGSKLLIFDKSTSVVGQEPTAEFLVTDGTKGGTRTFTITGDPLPHVGTPFNAGPFFSLGNRVLFEAFDDNRLPSLWVSNGTAAGTRPLSVKGAPAGGLAPADFTAFGDKALFVSIISEELWITDGTAGGTRELNAEARLGTEDITVAGGKAFFNSGIELWVTDGTKGGTNNLHILGGTLTAFGNKVLDASSLNHLFVSDGTLPGTHQIA